MELQQQYSDIKYICRWGNGGSSTLCVKNKSKRVLAYSPYQSSMETRFFVACLVTGYVDFREI